MPSEKKEPERRGIWVEGQQVPLTKDKSSPTYTIAGFIGLAGNIHISETGRYHVFWHREKADGIIILVHHGGEEGFATLRDVKRQHERVLLRYTGVIVPLPLDQPGEIPVEEQTEGIPIAGLTFPEMIRDFRTLELPGEQKTLSRWIVVLQDSNRDLPNVQSIGQLVGIKQNLSQVKGELVRSINRHKRNAAVSLEEGLAGSKGELLLAVNKAQIDLLKRSQQTVSIVVGTMQRYDDLDTLQRSWNGIVESLPGITGSVLKTLQAPSFIDEARLERVVHNNILDEKIGLEARLQQLKGEPYFTKAQEFISSLARLKALARAGSYQAMIPVLEKQTLELVVWNRNNRVENAEVDFGKYNLG